MHGALRCWRHLLQKSNLSRNDKRAILRAAVARPEIRRAQLLELDVQRLPLSVQAAYCQAYFLRSHSISSKSAQKSSIAMVSPKNMKTQHTK